jgi:hypothetical protein
LYVENTFQLIAWDVMVAKYFENESRIRAAVDAFQFFVCVGSDHLLAVLRAL